MNSISNLKTGCTRVWTIGFMHVVLIVAAAVLVMTPARASAETRTLKIYYVHTGERAEITFKQNGRYLADGLKKLNVFLRDWRRNEPTKMDPRLFDLVWQVYKASGSRDYVTVVSAYRSPATNKMLRSKTSGVAENSQHTVGRAMDFFIPGVPLKTLRALGLRYQVGGVGYYPTSGSPFVHMDVGSVRHWPRMNRRDLLAVFPNGNTVHVPSDGKPLPGYKQALAAVAQRKASGTDVIVASAAPAKKSSTLFGALFGGGGGADEDEDMGDSRTRAVAAAKPARAAPAKPAIVAPVPVRAPVPAVPVQAPQEQLVAALPARDVPRPVVAPRPEAAVAAEPEQLPFAVVALNVPIPAHKPAIAPQEVVVMAAAIPVDTVADAADVTEVASTMLTGFVPVPVTRPQHSDQVQLAAATVPATRTDNSEKTGQDAIAALVNADKLADTMMTASRQVPAVLPLPGKMQQSVPQEQLAMVRPQNDIEELIAPPDDDDYVAPVLKVTPSARPTKPVVSVLPVALAQPVAKDPIVIGKAADTGVRTTAKGAKPHVNLAKANKAQAARVQPAIAPTSEIAMSSESVSQAVSVTNPVLRNDALRAAPTMVYTAGFQRDLPTVDRAGSFRGNAVTFLSIAKFSKTN